MVSKAIAPKSMGTRPYVLRKGVSSLSDLRDGASAWGYPGDYPGRVYYVNNIHGASTNEGLSWDQPFAQVSEAITASEAYRVLYTGTTNDYQRNIIYIQGTGTAYTGIVALPSHCDMIGVGADPSGNGSGIARIGADAGTGLSGVLATASVRGLGVYNLQFQAGMDGYCFKGTNLFRSSFDNCVFQTNGVPGGGAPAAGFEMGIMGGVTMRNCLWNTAGGDIHQPVIGFNVTGTHFHGCRVENCVIGGDTGVKIAGGCLYAYASWFKDCYIGTIGDTCDIGVDDNATTGHIVYANCWVQASDTFDLVNNANRIIGCYKANALDT